MTETDNYREIFLTDAPMIDTRAPVEFERGSFPYTVNLPLMSDDERARVGTCYKKQGQDAAIKLGHQLVSGKVKEERLNNWLAFAKQNPTGYLYCFRGGLRSKICQQWLADAGCDYPRIIGGYKAMRRFLIETLEHAISTRNFVILGGHTGSAKTELLNTIPYSIDLEGLANHRGSAFGKRIDGQPSQIDFENALSVKLLKHEHQFSEHPILLEDESRLIGHRLLPEQLQARMKLAPLILVETTLEERVDHSFQNYILRNCEDAINALGQEHGFLHFAEELQQSLSNIRRRLGGERYIELKKQMDFALEKQKNGDNTEHRVWIEALLRDYYDPMYSYQIEQKLDRVVYRGRPEDIKEYIDENHHTNH